MTDYRKYINALRKCAKERENDRTSTGHIIVSDLCRDTANLLEELEKEYQRGANDTWECIKKINYLDYKQMDEIFDIDCGGDWIFAFDKILKEYSPLEAISLIKEYELKKKEENKEKVVKIADVLNDINDVLDKYNLEVVSYDTTSVFTDVSLDWQFGVKARFDVDENNE